MKLHILIYSLSNLLVWFRCGVLARTLPSTADSVEYIPAPSSHHRPSGLHRSAAKSNTTSGNGDYDTSIADILIYDLAHWDYTVSSSSPGWGQPGFSYHEVKYPAVGKTIAHFGVSSDDQGNNKDLLLIDFIDLVFDKRPTGSKPKASDLILGFWSFEMKRNINFIARLNYVMITEPSMEEEAPKAYESMGVDWLAEDLSVKKTGTAQGEQQAYNNLLTRTRFGKSATHMITDYGEMALRNLVVSEFYITPTMEDGMDFPVNFNVQITLATS